MRNPRSKSGLGLPTSFSLLAGVFFFGRATQNGELFYHGLVGNGYIRPGAPLGMKNAGTSAEILTPAPTSIRHATGVLRNPLVPVLIDHPLHPKKWRQSQTICSTESSSRLAPVHGNRKHHSVTATSQNRFWSLSSSSRTGTTRTTLGLDLLLRRSRLRIATRSRIRGSPDWRAFLGPIETRKG